MPLAERATNRPVEILLVEDNHADARMLRVALDQIASTCNLEVAVDGPEAFQRLYGNPEETGTTRPDMILLDLNLPGISGHEVLERIKSDPLTQSIPVIVMSSSHSPDDVKRAYGLHANSYVNKPHDLDALFRIVSTLEAFWFKIACLPTRQ
ncbi:MAG: response regulator [Bryobacteraceae bacterium]|nr:response regulator [Bryobacteraceae bacterium]